MDVQFQWKQKEPPVSGFQIQINPLISIDYAAEKGYCFLLVDAFAALLCSLGFKVSLHTATCSPVPEPEVRGVSTMMGY